MTYFVDAHVLSEPTKPTPDPRVVTWLRAHERDIAVDAGVGVLNCLPWDAETGLKWAELLARLRTTGKAMPIKDSLIAATARIIAEAGEDELVMGEFGNAGDSELVW